ncbi:cytochrome P460 family protein [Pseudomonas citronellolis]|uniref:cytochrome P460 family protein n=1 Tax=Pseudomonas citronellolis TaxID=53408 RepID=UPI002FD88196
MTPRLTALAAAALALALAAGASADPAPAADASPIYGVRMPEGYRTWQLVAPAQEAAPLNELRAVLGNDIAMQAYRAGKLPFPDGSVLAKLAWKHVQSPEFEPASIPGAATTVQFMVKDSKKYAATGGWGFARFIDGKPADEAQHQTCYACHQARVKNHDLVFTRYAP